MPLISLSALPIMLLLPYSWLNITGIDDNELRSTRSLSGEMMAAYTARPIPFCPVNSPGAELAVHSGQTGTQAEVSVNPAEYRGAIARIVP
jgi:hypothetical protein